MNLLILGGTIFLGRHLVDVARERGHSITLFNRGKSNPNLYPDVETIIGDRKVSLDSLSGRSWDAVIDTCGYFPRDVRASVEALKDSAGHYTFVSSISVYSDFSRKGMDERAPVAMLDDYDSVTEITGENYGALKAACEREAEAIMPGRVLNLRPGLIVGPNDPSDRFTYWVDRVARGGEVLAPGQPEGAIQFIDVRDLAMWMVDAVTAGTTGVYHSTGPDKPLTFGDFLKTCRKVGGSNATLTWVDEKFLAEENVAPYMEMPLWLPEEYSGGSMVDLAKIRATSFQWRDVGETIRDTLAWHRERQTAGGGLRAGISAEREAELLEKWHAVNR